MKQHMTVMREFSLSLDKERVLRGIDCREDSPVYQEVNSIYEGLLEGLWKVITPMGVFQFYNNVDELDLDILNCSNILVYSFITLGEGVSRKTEEFFSKGNYLEALIFDTMTSELLFHMGEEIYQKISEEAKEQGLSLKNRISPGDEETPLYYQRIIWEKLKLKDLGININDEHLLQPLKSIATIYTTTNWDQSIKIHSNCKTCRNQFCKMRRNDI